MEPGHLLHSALTCTSRESARNLKSIHVPVAQQLISSFDDNNRRVVACRKVGEHYETSYFHSRPTLLEWSCQEQRGSGLTTSAPASDVSALVGTKGRWPLLRLVSVGQKMKPLTMLSSTVQSIDLPMESTAWRFWMMRQSIGCSTPAPRSRAA